jgi:hypothetical protein
MQRTWDLVAGQQERDNNRDVQRYQADNQLRGHLAQADASMYGADQKLRGDMVQAGSASRTAQANALRDAVNYQREERKYGDDRRDKDTERLDSVLKTMSTEGGKLNDQKYAQARNGVQAFLATAADAARKAGNHAGAAQIEHDGETALVRDPSLMARYAASLKLDNQAQGRLFHDYNATDNPGAHTIDRVENGTAYLANGTTLPSSVVTHQNNGILPHRFAHLDPTADRTTEFDRLYAHKPKGAAQK